MIILIVTGVTCCGKNYFAEYLSKEYSFHNIELSNILRKEVEKRGYRTSQDKMRLVFNEIGGQIFITNNAIEQIKQNNWQRVCVSGEREVKSFLAFKKAFANIKLIVVESEPKIRFQRMLKRGRANDPKMYKEFLEYNEVEEKWHHMSDLFKLADYVIENNGSLEEFENRIDELINKLI